VNRTGDHQKTKKGGGDRMRRNSPRTKEGKKPQRSREKLSDEAAKKNGAGHWQRAGLGWG